MREVIDVFFDVETTGLGHKANPPREDTILEIGMAYRAISWYANDFIEAMDKLISKGNDSPTSEQIRTLLISWGKKPENKVYSYGQIAFPSMKYVTEGRADEAMRINGITSIDLLKSPMASEVAKHVRAQLGFLNDREDCEVILHAYNIDFDRPFLEAEPWNIQGIWGRDPMKMYADLFNDGRYAKLTNAMAHLEIERQGRQHTAESDAICAMLLYEKLIEIEEAVL